MDDNRLAVDQAAELGALVLVLVCGPAPNRNLVAARDYVADCVVELCEYGAERGVKIGIEPLHPMYCGDRSVVVTLDQALAMTQGLAPARAGVVVDTYHVWWDPSVVEKIRACGPKIAGFHLADWLVPTPDMLNGRGMLGDGVVDMRSLREAVDGAGYDGPIEVELFNPDIWAIPGDDCLRLIKERYSAHVLSGAQP
jgi:sugar phosphate isomerase/epimerase